MKRLCATVAILALSGGLALAQGGGGGGSGGGAGGGAGGSAGASSGGGSSAGSGGTTAAPSAGARNGAGRAWASAFWLRLSCCCALRSLLRVAAT